MLVEKKKIFLIDAMALIYRAYFALQKNPRFNQDGLNTSAIMGFANALVEVLNKEKPTHLVVAFESATPLLRKDSYPLYKANREAQPR